MEAHNSVEEGSQPEAEKPHKTTCQGSNNEVEKEKQKVTRHADVMDLATEVQVQVSTQLESRLKDLEAATCCTLFVPKESDVTEMENAGSFLFKRHGNKPPRQR